SPLLRWSLRLFRAQIALIYVSTALWKLQGPTWRNGTALYFSLRHQLFPMLGSEWLLGHPGIMAGLTWLTFLIELALGILIWLPSLRSPLIVIGLIFHGALRLVINVPYWQFIMSIGLLSFVDRRQLDWLAQVGERARRRLKFFPLLKSKIMEI